MGLLHDVFHRVLRRIILLLIPDVHVSCGIAILGVPPVEGQTLAYLAPSLISIVFHELGVLLLSNIVVEFKRLVCIKYLGMELEGVVVPFAVIEP